MQRMVQRVALRLVGAAALVACTHASIKSFTDVRAAVRDVSHGCPLVEDNSSVDGMQQVSCGDFKPPPHGYRWKSAQDFKAVRFGFNGALGGSFYAEGPNWLVVTSSRTDADKVATILGGKAHSASDFH